MPRVAKLLLITLAFASTASVGAGDDPVSNPKARNTEAVWGQITRTKEMSAEFNLSTRHGIWAGGEVDLYLPGVDGKPRLIGTMTVERADEHQSVGKSSTIVPTTNHLVLFRKPKPSGADDSPINRLIGADVDVIFQSEASRGYVYRALALNANTSSHQDIESLVLVFPSINTSKTPQTYPASSIKKLTAGGIDFVFDAVTRTLAESGVVSSREIARKAERENKRVLAEREAEAREKPADARLLAKREAAVRPRAEEARLVAERKPTPREKEEKIARVLAKRQAAARDQQRRVLEYRKRHLILDVKRSRIYPEPGYQWVNPADKLGAGVKWTPGTVHYGAPHVVASQQEGGWQTRAGGQRISMSNIDVNKLLTAAILVGGALAFASAENGNAENRDAGPGCNGTVMLGDPCHCKGFRAGRAGDFQTICTSCHHDEDEHYR
jgi:hypothetical protein